MLPTLQSSHRIHVSNMRLCAGILPYFGRLPLLPLLLPLPSTERSLAEL
jgi:hypothetical protein